LTSNVIRDRTNAWPDHVNAAACRAIASTDDMNVFGDRTNALTQSRERAGVSRDRIDG
jgi:hypothetical protein